MTLYLEAGDYNTERGEAELTLRALKVRDAERPAPFHLLRLGSSSARWIRYGEPVTSCVIERDASRRALDKRGADDGRTEQGLSRLDLGRETWGRGMTPDESQPIPPAAVAAQLLDWLESRGATASLNVCDEFHIDLNGIADMTLCEADCTVYTIVGLRNEIRAPLVARRVPDRTTRREDERIH